MGNPNAATGHSLEWQQAYLTAAPQDDAQRALVAQMAIPMGASQTHEQAKRVDALRGLIGGLDPSAAEHLYGRLSSAHDSLGQLFELTLHPTTQKSLLGLLNAKRHGLDRGTAPASRGTDTRRPPPPPPARPTPPPSPTGRPPTPVPPVTVTPPRRIPHPPPDTLPPDTLPFSPVPPGDVYIAPPQDSGGDGWIWKPLKLAAGTLGVTLSAWLSMLSPSTVAKAVEAAWVVFQTYEGTEVRALMGLAGEAAAEVVLADLFGVDVARVVNLNDLQANFPLIDHVLPGGLVQTKALGAASMLAGAALAERNQGQVAGLLYDVIVGGDGPRSKLVQAADGLLNLRGELKRRGAWPSDLRATTREGVVEYIRGKLMFALPNNIAIQEQRILGEKLYSRLNNPQAMTKLGLKTQTQLAKYVSGQVGRILPLGVTADDLRAMAETALTLPDAQAAPWRAKYAGQLRKKGTRPGRP